MEDRGCGECRPGDGWCVKLGVRGQGSTVHLGRAGVVGLWVWEVGRRGSVRERGGVGEAGTTESGWGQRWEVGLPTQALGSRELDSSSNPHPTVLALPWNTQCVGLLNDNQAFSCKTQTTQPWYPWIQDIPFHWSRSSELMRVHAPVNAQVASAFTVAERAAPPVPGASSSAGAGDEKCNYCSEGFVIHFFGFTDISKALSKVHVPIYFPKAFYHLVSASLHSM